MRYIIQDWAANTLQHTGKFNFGAYGRQRGIPMEFTSFEGAWDWIYRNVEPDNDAEDKYDDLYVEKL